ncbi:hyaluronate lyase N-terminal domain-containing protein, partial [Streptococcus dysgalactiae]
MSKEVASARIQHRGMSTQEWESSSDILMEREIGIDMTTGYPKVGDGKSRFSELKDLRGERGDKGDSITITKQLRVLDGVQITFSDETQVTIPKGEKGDSVKGDRGKSVESARVDESGHLRLKIEEEQEKDLGNVKGDKGDSITITDQQRVSEGVQLTFSDKTKVVIPKGEKGDTGDVNGINLD